jgi:hypothetical protein
MANKVDITLPENNDARIHVAITTNVPVDGTVLDLTGLSLEAGLKPNASTADTDLTVWKGTTAGGEITVTDAVHGLATISIPAAFVTQVQTWWRCDVVSGGLRNTAPYGVLTVINL